MSAHTANILFGGPPPAPNDFDADMYYLNKLRATIYNTLSTAPVGDRFAFIGNELADTSSLIDPDHVAGLEFTLPLPVWEEL